MERCASTEISVETGGGDGEETTKDAYECRICGYKAIDVTYLSKHLHAAHPVTSLLEARSLRSDRYDKRVEDREGVDDDDDDELTSPSSPANDKAATEGSDSPSPRTVDDLNQSSSTIEAQEQDYVMDISPVSKTNQNSSPVSPQEKSNGSLEAKHTSHKKQTFFGTTAHNQTNLICLPLVSEGLKFIWVRSEQLHELDEVSDLIEAFNEFPYPTPQEASALARKCALSPDRVKAWFMMQRVRYGISWGDDDIRETRRKLWHVQKRTAAEDCGDVDDERHELQDYLGHDRRSIEMQQVFKQPAMAEAHHKPKPSHSVPQRTTNDQQNNITSQSNNCVQQLSNANVMFNNGLQLLTQVPYLRSGNITPHNTEVQVFNAYGQSPYMAMNDQHTAAQYNSGPDTLSRSFQILSGKKSKAQLMALRRSFVHKSWPSDAEVQRIQETTGLSCREIRKWFADSRYQLRRNGRAWLSKLTKHNYSWQEGQQNDSLASGNEADGTDAPFDVDDLGMDDNEAAYSQSEELIQEISDEGEFEDSTSSIPQYLAERSTSPLSSPSSSFPHGRVEPNVRIRKKTREQLEILRQSFLHCQWPTSEDYLILQQKTGLTKTEIIQWYGDTRYHIKHNQMRWMTSQERQRIIEVITQQQKRSGKNMRSKISIELSGSGDSTVINGSGSSTTITWNDLFRENTPVVPEGELSIEKQS